MQEIGLGGPGLGECVVSVSPVALPLTPREGPGIPPLSLIEKLHNDVQTTKMISKVWVGGTIVVSELTILTPSLLVQLQVQIDARQPSPALSATVSMASI